MKELYIDFDGVILDTIEKSYAEMDKLGIDKKDYEAAGKYFKSLNWEEFINNTEPINDSITCIKKIIDSGRFRVSILTHIVSLEEAIAKVKYIRKFFKDITIIPVPKEISKTKMVHSEGAILVDDYSGNLREWEKANGIGVRFSKKRNSKGFLVVDKLDQILDLPI